jgi:hypothetical protein
MGFEGLIAYDISELINNGNPWSENDNIIALPVFKNTFNELSADEMLRKATETAEVMGWDIDKLYIEPSEEQLQRERDKINSFNSWIEEKENMPDDLKKENYMEYTETKPYMAVAKCGEYTIEARWDGLVRIDFGDNYGGSPPGLILPDKYSFTYHNTTEQQAQEVMQYLLKEYNSFVNMKSPAIALFGDYNIYAQRIFSYTAYENDGDLIDKILGYHFDTVRFAPNDEGNLYIIDRNKTDLSEKISDYPIITAQEARELLLQNRYITTVPFDTVHYDGDFIDENYIVAVELVYRTAPWEEVFMPYYKFYIELTGFQMLEELNLKNFGIFYVPAVKEEYLTNMPVWDGRFN